MYQFHKISLKIVLLLIFISQFVYMSHVEAGVISSIKNGKGFDFKNDDDNNDSLTAKVACKITGSPREVNLGLDILCNETPQVSPATTAKSFCDLSVDCERQEYTWEESTYNKRSYTSSNKGGENKASTGNKMSSSFRLFCLKERDVDCSKMSSEQLVKCASEKMDIEKINVGQN